MKGITVFFILCTGVWGFAEEAEQEKISPFDAAVRDYQLESYDLFRNGYPKAFPGTAVKLTAKQPTPYEVMTSRSPNPFLSEEKVDQPDYRAAGKAVSEFGNAVNSWQGTESTLPTWTGSPDTGSRFKELAKTANPNDMLPTSVIPGHEAGESKSRLEAFQRGVTNSSSAVTSEFNARQKEFDAANKAAKEQAELTERQFAEAQMAQQQALANQANNQGKGGGGGGGDKSGSGSGSGSGDSASKPLDLSGVNRGLASIKPPEEAGFPEMSPPSGLGKGATSSSTPITPVSLSNQATPSANNKTVPPASDGFPKLTLSGSKETPNQLFFDEKAGSGPGGFPDSGSGNTPVKNANTANTSSSGGEPPPLGKTPNDSRQFFQTNRGGGFLNGGSSGGDGGSEGSVGGSDESSPSSSASIAKNSRPTSSDEPLPAVNDKSGLGILAYRHNIMKQLCARPDGIKGFDCHKDQNPPADRQIAMEPPRQTPNFIMLGQSGAL